MLWFSLTLAIGLMKGRKVPAVLNLQQEEYFSEGTRTPARLSPKWLIETQVALCYVMVEWAGGGGIWTNHSLPATSLSLVFTEGISFYFVSWAQAITALPCITTFSISFIHTLIIYWVSSSHVWMWELDYKESWALKNWCFWTVVLEKTLESPLDCKEIQPVHPKGDQSWVFIGRTDVEAETPILWPPHVKSWLIWKDPDTGKNWGQEQKGMTEDEMVGWHHRLNGHEFE